MSAGALSTLIILCRGLQLFQRSFWLQSRPAKKKKKKKKPEARLLWMFSLVLVFLVKNYGSENISKNVV